MTESRDERCAEMEWVWKSNIQVALNFGGFVSLTGGECPTERKGVCEGCKHFRGHHVSPGRTYYVGSILPACCAALLKDVGRHG